MTPIEYVQLRLMELEAEEAACRCYTLNVDMQLRSIVLEKVIHALKKRFEELTKERWVKNAKDD
jgi:hypothetical protein